MYRRLHYGVPVRNCQTFNQKCADMTQVIIKDDSMETEEIAVKSKSTKLEYFCVDKLLTIQTRVELCQSNILYVPINMSACLWKLV